MALYKFAFNFNLTLVNIGIADGCLVSLYELSCSGWLLVTSSVHSWAAGSWNIGRMCASDGSISPAENAVCEATNMALWHHD